MNETTQAFNRLAPDTKIQDQLAKDYAAMVGKVEDLAKQAGEMPAEITTQEQHDQVVEFLSEATSATKRVEGARVAEKDRYLQGERQVDGFFNKLKERLKNMDTRLNQRVTDFLRRRADEERVARQKLAERREQAEQQAIRDAEESQRLANEAAAEEERIKASQTPSNFDVMEKADEKAGHIADADNSLRQAVELGNQAKSIADSVNVKPADLVRNRTENACVLPTLKTEWKFTVEDYDKIPLEELRPYLSNADLEKAVRAYVRKNKGSKPIAGVRIYEESTATRR